MDDKLKAAIEKFADSRKDRLTTPNGAYCMCDSTSDAFIRFAVAEGVTVPLARYDFELTDWIIDKDGVGHTIDHPRNPDPTLYQRGQHPAAQFRRAGWHAIVDAGDILIDFTARQYHQDACYPHITSKALLATTPHVDADDTHADIIAAAAAAGGN